MKKVKKAYARSDERNKIQNILAICVVIFTVAFIPIIVRLKIFEDPANTLPDAYDFFAFWKSWALYITAIAALIPLFIALKNFLFNKKQEAIISIISKEKRIFLILTGLYLAACLFSTILSKNISIALFGYRCQSEGFFTIASVFIITACGMLFIKGCKINLIYKAIYISAGIIFIIGIFQFIGLDPFKADLIKSIIIPGKYGDLANSILFPDNPSSSFRNSIYSTLYNSNVFGTYAALIMVFSMSRAIYSADKKHRMFSLFIMSLALFTLINCFSRGAYLGAAFGSIVIALMTLKRIKNYYKSIIPVAIIIVLVIIAAALIGKGKVFERLSTVDIDTQDAATGVTERISDFSLINNKLILFFNKRSLNIEKRGNDLVFSDTEGREMTIDYSPEDEGYKINKDNYRDFIVFADRENLFVKKKNALLRFIIRDDGFILADAAGKEAKISGPQSGVFTGRERFASGRGYIWSRTIPLIKKNIVVGSGPDTFYYAFPQDDYQGKLKFMYNAYINIDMAHNIFLQKAIETGGFSMIIFVIIIIWMLLSAFRKSSALMLAITVVYCVCGLFTDENICTMIVFWPLIGIEFANLYSSDGSE
ncbi:MAG TPA: O-antigen ligase family protein [Pseudobacteroides sp.]|uniref:O-antigen ligase family protein n=1 Tax=Pseudobacteroides sp. TaxID=1968840 RepID=UPI002F92C3FF